MITTNILLLVTGNAPDKNDIKKLSKIENKEDLMVGSSVKVLLDSDVHYGVIRWIGIPPGISPGKLMAAVELVSMANDSCVRTITKVPKNKVQQYVIHRMMDIL